MLSLIHALRLRLIHENFRLSVEKAKKCEVFVCDCVCVCRAPAGGGLHEAVHGRGREHHDAAAGEGEEHVLVHGPAPD